MITPIFQVRKPRLRIMTRIAQSHTANEWQGQHLSRLLILCGSLPPTLSSQTLDLLLLIKLCPVLSAGPGLQVVISPDL